MVYIGTLFLPRVSFLLYCLQNQLVGSFIAISLIGRVKSFLVNCDGKEPPLDLKIITKYTIHVNTLVDVNMTSIR